MILLDTNAVIWLLMGHVRAQPLLAAGRLHLSPVSLLELQFLQEVGKLQFHAGVTMATVASDQRWLVDDPSSSALFNASLDLAWTRDPFDRLLVAHARLRRWRLATGDRLLCEKLASGVMAL